MVYGGLAVCDVWGVWKKFGFDKQGSIHGPRKQRQHHWSLVNESNLWPPEGYSHKRSMHGTCMTVLTFVYVCFSLLVFVLVFVLV